MVLARFGIVTASAEDWQNVTNNHANSVVTPGRVVWSRRLTLKMEELVPFQERIGVCYCAHKQQRLAVAAAFYRAKNYSVKQAQKVTAAFDEMTVFCDADH